MNARDWLCIGLMMAGVFLFIIGWFVPKWAKLEPTPVIFAFLLVATVVFWTGAENLSL